MLIKKQMAVEDLNIKEVATHNIDMMLLLADRHVRASTAMIPWATAARECIEFVEGNQWSEEEMAKLRREKRPALKWNKIRPLVRLVLGYHRNNRMTTKYLPGWDGSGTADVAQALTHLDRQIGEINHEPYVDTEVFLDGICGGRAYYDYRMGFEDNELGETKIGSKEPFSILLDPDGEDYDINKSGYVIEDRWVNLDEIEFTYGKTAAALVSPLVGSSGISGVPYSIVDFAQQIAPWRTFGGRRGIDGFRSMEAYYFQAYDPLRRNIRIIDCQHYIRVMQKVFLDLETGSKQPIPESWDEQRIQKALQWANEKYAARGQASPLRVVNRPERRVRWTTAIGDIIVWDEWSPYRTFTIVPFFPWFRRGKTEGMVNDLVDPQREINKRGSAEIDIVTRTAYSGWMYHKSGLNEEGKIKLERHGATPGINIEWQGDVHMEPKQIVPPAPPTALDHLQQKNSDALKEISSINESSLGQLDRVQSGVALEARQRQAVIGIQIYMDNMTRTKELCGGKKLELIQDHYTEERTYRLMGDDGKDQQLTINKRLESGEIANDVTNGRYSLDIDETPLSASFLSAQFDEMERMVKEGILPIPVVQSVMVDASSIPQKDTIKRNLAQFNATGTVGTPPPVMPGAAPGGAPAGLPGAAEQGASIVQPAGAGAPPPSMVAAHGAPVRPIGQPQGQPA